MLTSVDTNKLSSEDRKDIFRNIFNYYNNVQHWIKFEIARNLSYYYDASQHSLLKHSAELKGSTYITKTNVAAILEFLLELNVLKESERAYWKSELVKFIKEKNSILQRAAISALSKYKDISLLKQIVEHLNDTDSSVIQSLIYACLHADPNDKSSIDCFIKWTKDDREYITARYGLWEVKEKKAVNYLLECFINDSAFLSQFMEHETIFSHRENDRIIQNIKNVCDEEIQAKLHQIVLSAFSDHQWYRTEKSEFVEYIVKLLKEKDSDYLFKLIVELKKSEALRKHLFSMRSIFLLLLEQRSVRKFVNELRGIGEGKIRSHDAAINLDL